MNIRNMKYGISAVCIAALVLLTSGCKRDELEIVNTQDDVIKFAFGDGSLPELKSGADGASGESRAIALEGDIDGMVLYRTERASDSFFGYVSETKGTPVTTSNLGDLYMNEFFTTAYDADYNSKFANPVKLAYEEIKEDKSIWRVTESFAWPEKDGKLSFWAWAPNDIVASTKTITDSEGKMAFTYTMPAPGAETEKTDAEAQKDIILGHTVTGKPDNYIEMTMDHALTALRFEMDNTTNFKIKSITLGGVYSTGTCTYSPDATKTHAYEQVVWSNLSSTQTYTQDFNQTIEEGTEDAPQEIGPQEATFMVIPQCATGGNAISFDMTIEIDGIEKHFTATLKDQDWKAGVTYTYGIDKNVNLKVTGEVEMNYIATEGTNTYTVNSDLPWQLQYTLDDGTTWADAESNTTIDGWISFDRVSGVGSGDDEIVTATVNEAVPEPITITIDHTSVLRNASQRGSSDAPWDLSTHDVDGNLNLGGKATTANCYVISAPGWYAIPLVYGNAIKEGIDNTPAYKNTTGTLTNFLKADGNAMESPYISGITTAYPLWEDVADFAIVADDGCVVLSQTDALAKGLTACNCGYVMFEVKRTTIKQGNAVIAVTDEDGIIQWSWHIWVTDDELTTTVVTNHDRTFNKNMLQLNLGWVDDSEETDALKYNDASLKLRFVQKSGASIINEVSKTAIRTDHISVVVSKNGSAPTWQWGRKDPFIRHSANTISELPSTNFSIHSTISSPIIITKGPVAINIAIKNPVNFYTSENANSYSWYKPYQCYNLWSANCNSYGHSAESVGFATSPVKTVYDPCPPKYQLPQGNAFTGFTKTGFLTSVTNDMNVCNYYDNGMDFYASGWKTGKTIFLPYQAYRKSDTGKPGANSANSVGRYWTAVPESAGTSIMLGFDKSPYRIEPLSYDGSRGTSFSIRPVLE